MPNPSPQGRRPNVFLDAIVIAHVAVALLHGAAHTGASVSLTPAGNAFVIGVVLLGPVIGLLMTSRARRAGAIVVAVTMTGAFLFGVVNHFLLPGDDHVNHVAAQWRTLFGTTAAFLALFEAGGAMYAMRLALRYNPREVTP
jgi:hypothetical protein